MAKIRPLKDGQVHPAYKVMNQLGYDAANLGNHEFNFGLPFLRRAIQGANFPYVNVNANVYVDDSEKTAPILNTLLRRMCCLSGSSGTRKVSFTH